MEHDSSMSRAPRRRTAAVREPQVDLPEVTPAPRWKVWVPIVAVTVATWMLFGFRVAERGMWSAHEGRAAQDAQSVLTDGDWLVPHLYTGEPELQKPPLYYWLVALTAFVEDGRVESINVRLPATLAAMGGVLIVFGLGRRMWNVETGLWAALILSTTTRFAWLGRVGRIDQPLCLVVLASLALFWRWISAATMDLPLGRRGLNSPLTYGVYVLLSIGVLLKGPVAVILVLLPIASFLFLAGYPIVPRFQSNWRSTWRALRIVPGMLLAAAIASPWYVAASIATHGEFFWSFFIYHNVERALGTSEALKSGPVWYYIPRLLTDAFPWSTLYPAMWLWLWKCRDRWLIPRSNASGQRQTTDLRYLFLGSWAVSQFAFLSFVSFKRADYLLPVFPAMALLLAGWLGERTQEALRAWSRRSSRSHLRWHRIILVSATLLAFLTIPLLTWGGVEFTKKGVVRSLVKVEILRDHLNETDLFMLDHVEHLMRENWPLLVIAGLFVVGSVWLFQTGWHQGGPRRVLVSMAAPWLVFFLFQVHVLLPALDPVREMSRFAKAIRGVAGTGTVYYFGKFDSDLAFHVGRPARDLTSWDEMVALDQKPDVAFVVIKAEQMEWVSRDPKMAGWEVVVDNRDLAFGGHRDARVLITNRPAVVARRLDDTRSSR